MVERTQPILEAQGITFAYPTRGGRRTQPILTNISFSGGAGDCIAIMGRSGIGKTTLCRILAGLIAPNTGAVLLRGRQMRRPSTHVTIAFQESPCFPWLTTSENVSFGLDGHRQEIAESLIRDLGLESVREKYPKELSGGMRQRVAIGRALAVTPACLILDEPFSALDIVTKRQLQELLQAERESRDLLLLVVLHSLEDALAIANRLLVLASTPARIAMDIPLDETSDYRVLRNRITEVMLQQG